MPTLKRKVQVQVTESSRHPSFDSSDDENANFRSYPTTTRRMNNDQGYLGRIQESVIRSNHNDATKASVAGSSTRASPTGSATSSQASTRHIQTHNRMNKHYDKSVQGQKEERSSNSTTTATNPESSRDTNAPKSLPPEGTPVGGNACKNTLTSAKSDGKSAVGVGNGTGDGAGAGAAQTRQSSPFENQNLQHHQSSTSTSTSASEHKNHMLLQDVVRVRTDHLKGPKSFHFNKMITDSNRDLVESMKEKLGDKFQRISENTHGDMLSKKDDSTSSSHEGASSDRTHHELNNDTTSSITSAQQKDPGERTKDKAANSSMFFEKYSYNDVLLGSRSFAPHRGNKILKYLLQKNVNNYMKGTAEQKKLIPFLIYKEISEKLNPGGRFLRFSSKRAAGDKISWYVIPQEDALSFMTDTFERAISSTPKKKDCESTQSPVANTTIEVENPPSKKSKLAHSHVNNGTNPSPVNNRVATMHVNIDNGFGNMSEAEISSNEFSQILNVDTEKIERAERLWEIVPDNSLTHPQRINAIKDKASHYAQILRDTLKNASPFSNHQKNAQVDSRKTEMLRKLVDAEKMWGIEEAGHLPVGQRIEQIQSKSKKFMEKLQLYA
mmetsp:Transcript_8251/g.12430  ORF Transcript_8251/g.12430 Transcript_8251/m.12430 type:complete len:610 (+) Transcript_8251:138-1967(+)|eukprot:CAMPEP_0203673734 /NCGR_PEP_ID=MMETSP0090-20130426/13574_1 /ASSEMBLY_ACC=CAM_ASM_001088 /TAXON_ID=426623 /ORGANISM="Chaetoceros affinis, Strain CCMP159" /LENGTH=609 /DNA_ID=CAMNT_0050539445 /DNA_START=59 /DNA_END=1888 /DNA_ORIENTATION=-